MESITSLYHLLQISTREFVSLQNLCSRKVVIDYIVILECVLSNQLLIHTRKVFSALISEISNSLVTIKPAPTRTDLQTVEEVIERLVCGIKWVCICVQIVVDHCTVCQTQYN